MELREKREDWKMARNLRTAGAVALACCLITGNSAKAESAAEFYKDNVVTMVVGYSPGGGSDYGARLLASYWNEVTGGAMVVKNMPGAGGLLALNYVYAAKPDGKTLVYGMFGSYLMRHLTKDRAMRFDYTKWNWLVGTFHEPWVLHISAKRSYQTIDDLKKAEGLQIGSTSPYGPSSIAAASIIDSLGLKAKIITGYKGGSALALAAGKGEVDLALIPAGIGINAIQKDFVKPPILVFSDEKTSAFPQTPTLPEVSKLSPKQKDLFEKINTASYIIRVGAAPPGTSPEKVEFLREAFAKVVNLKGFKRQSKLNFPLGPTPMLGKKLVDFATRAANIEIDAAKTLTKKFLAIN